MLTVNFIFCPSKANSWRLKSISCNKNEPKQCIEKRQERSSDRTENGKCTNVTNGIQLTPFYTFFSNLPDGRKWLFTLRSFSSRSKVCSTKFADGVFLNVSLWSSLVLFGFLPLYQTFVGVDNTRLEDFFLNARHRL